MRRASKRKIPSLVAASIQAVLAALLVDCCRPAAAETICKRIVSLAPSVTETAYDLGLGEHLVGRTRFCRYPQEVKSVTEVGGFYDVSVEAIVAQKPTHIITLRESADVATSAARFGAEVIVVDHASVTGIKESIRAIGERCGVAEQAEKKLAEYAQREWAVAARIADTDQPRTLVVVGRAQEGSETSALYISGSDGFYTEVLKLAGAQNVNQSRTVPVPIISTEGLQQLNPEAVFEVVNVDDVGAARNARKLWGQFSELSAVKKGAVFILEDDFASIPGPRYILLVEKLAALLHPTSNLLNEKEQS